MTFQCTVMHATWTALSGSLCAARQAACFVTCRFVIAVQSQVDTFVNSASKSHSLVFQGEPVGVPCPEAVTLSW
eukprot:3562065-Pleurochrysis_carterae.AAC.2